MSKPVPAYANYHLIGPTDNLMWYVTKSCGECHNTGNSESFHTEIVPASNTGR